MPAPTIAASIFAMHIELIEARVLHALFVTYENLVTKNKNKKSGCYRSFSSLNWIQRKMQKNIFIINMPLHNNIDNHSFLVFFFLSFFLFYLQQLFRSQNPNLASNTGVPPPGQPGGQPLPQTLPLPSQQYLAQQSAAYAAAAQQAAPYVINPGQDAAQYMGLIAAAGMPQYYGVAPWGVYPANLIPQQGTQPRRPLTPSQQAGENQPSYQVG